MLLRVLLLVTSPILSVFLLSVADSFFVTLVSLRLKDIGYSETLIATITSAYCIGTLVGSFYATRFIFKVLHIRAFAAFAAVLAISSMLQGFLQDYCFWIMLRFCCGAAIYSLYIVVESWLLELSNTKSRGQILSIYTIGLYSAQVISQQFLQYTGVDTLLPYCITGIIICLSIIPISLTSSEAPKMEQIHTSELSLKKLFNLAPLGVVTCILGGAVVRSLYTFLPLAAENLGYNTQQIGNTMSTLGLGAMLLQYPIGKLSDMYPRKRVIFWLAFNLVVTSSLCIFTSSIYTLFLLSILLLGGSSFTLYTIGVTYACDFVEQKDIVPATSGLLFFYGSGAVIGPYFQPVFTSLYENSGHAVFALSSCVGLILIAYCFVNKRREISPNSPMHQEHINVSHTTPIANELDPRSDDLNNDDNNNNDNEIESSS